MKTGTEVLSGEELNLVTLAQKYSDNDAARELLESMLWPDGPVCPHCKNHKDKAIYAITPKPGSKTRKGLRKCGACRKQFTVTIGTIFEDTHIPIGKWMMALFLLSSSKKGMSAHQLHRMLDIGYQAAWFMCHRIRYAMNETPFQKLMGTVEVDETYVGGKGDLETKSDRKTPVVALVERNGKARTQVVADVTGRTLRAAMTATVSKDAVVNTDAACAYRGTSGEFKAHHVVNHSGGEYARKNFDGTLACTNTVESFFSLLKRGVMGSFHHVSRHHLHRYATEFEFRWNNRSVKDGERMEVLVEQTQGKRLTYKRCV